MLNFRVFFDLSLKFPEFVFYENIFRPYPLFPTFWAGPRVEIMSAHTLIIGHINH